MAFALMEKTHAKATHIIMNQLQKINNAGFNVVRSSTATYIHTGNYYVLFLFCCTPITSTMIFLNRDYKGDTMIKHTH